MTTLIINETGPLKRDIIEMAFEECGSAGYEFERDPDEVAAALRKLNAMMREWPWNSLGFVQSDYGAGLPEEHSGIPHSALGAVAGYLALRLAPMLGASLSSEAKSALAKSYTLIMSEAGAAIVPAHQFARGTALGTGNSTRITFTRDGR